MSDDAVDTRDDRSKARLETPDVAAGAIIKIMVGLAAFVALTIAAAFYLRSFHELDRPVPTEFAAPRLQEDSGSDELKAFQKAEDEELNNYAWVDRARGVIRIPITQAMLRVVARGQRGYAPLEPPAGQEPR